MSTGQTSGAVALRFFLPPKRLRPFVTTLYHLEIFDEGDELVEDWLHPEWANLRIIPQRTIDAGMAGGPLENLPRAVIVGPTSVTAHFRARPGRSWGIGLMPRGWARLSQAPADEYADRWADAESDPAFTHLAALCGAVPLESGGLAAERDALLRELTLLLAEPAAREAEIL
ncbi:MAG: AraC family transcriptional regulator, partial [Pseudomonadota bacterium]|nr:AraC family transcriptional regulator [Pseudomonadota bacterium]